MFIQWIFRAVCTPAYAPYDMFAQWKLKLASTPAQYDRSLLSAWVRLVSLAIHRVIKVDPSFHLVHISEGTLSHNAHIAPDKAFFTKKYWYLSYFLIKAYVVGTH